MNDMLRYFFSLATIAKIQATLITLALSFGLYLDNLIDFGWMGFVAPVFLNLKFDLELSTE